jgi:hypothetical protein
MAGEEYLALLGLNDLNQFSQTVQQSDPYGMTGRALGAWQPDYSGFNAQESAVTSFAKAFTSGLLQNYARNNAAEQMNSVVGILPQLRADPLHVATPEGVDPGAFSTLRGSAILKNFQQQAIDAQTEKKFNSDLLARLLGKKADIIGEDAGYKALGQGESVNPESPAGKLAKEERAKADSVESEIRGTLKSAPIVQAYQIRQSALQNILANLNNDSTYGDLALINGFQTVQDPQSSVKEGDVATIQAAQDRLSRYFGDVKGWFSADGRLKPEYRRQLAETAANTTNAYGKIYSQYVDENLEAVRRVKGDVNKIPYVPHREIKISDYLNSGIKSPPASGPKIKESELIGMGYTKGPNGWIPPAEGAPRG